MRKIIAIMFVLFVSPKVNAEEVSLDTDIQVKGVVRAHRVRISELEAKVAELEKKLAECMEQKQASGQQVVVFEAPDEDAESCDPKLILIQIKEALKSEYALNPKTIKRLGSRITELEKLAKLDVPELKKRMDEIEGTLEEIRRTIPDFEQLNSVLAQVQNQQEIDGQTLKDLAKDLEKIQAGFKKLQQRFDDLLKRYDALESRMMDLEDKVRKKQDRLRVTMGVQLRFDRADVGYDLRWDIQIPRPGRCWPSMGFSVGGMGDGLSFSLRPLMRCGEGGWTVNFGLSFAPTFNKDTTTFSVDLSPLVGIGYMRGDLEFLVSAGPALHLADGEYKPSPILEAAVLYKF